MQKRVLIVGVVALLALAGCSSTPEVEAETAAPSPTVTVSANKAACEGFADIVLTIPSRLGNEDTAFDNYAALQTDFDEVALTADGIVQERMLDLVENWPEPADVLVFNEVDVLNTSFDAVERACAADGVDREIGELTTS
jgi:hypothetical protein